jgi:hypothetical protein
MIAEILDRKRATHKAGATEVPDIHRVLILDPGVIYHYSNGVLAWLVSPRSGDQPPRREMLLTRKSTCVKAVV